MQNSSWIWCPAKGMNCSETQIQCTDKTSRMWCPAMEMSCSETHSPTQTHTHTWNRYQYLESLMKKQILPHWPSQPMAGLSIYWLLLYSVVLCSSAYSLRSHVILQEWIAFYITFLNIHRSGVLTALAWLVPQESAARESQSRRVLCTPYDHAPCHFMQSHIHKVYACLAVTCHLRFWQNDRGLLHATAVTLGWNGYRRVSTESWPWRRKFSHHSSRDLNPRTFDHESGALTTELSLLPKLQD